MTTAKTKNAFNAITRNRADAAFSNYIRARAGWRCERCYLPFHWKSAMNLHCSHNYSRSELAIRYHPDNAFALCRDCHNWFSFNKIEATQWLQGKLGQEKINKLLNLSGTGKKPDMAKGSKDIQFLDNLFTFMTLYENMQQPFYQDGVIADMKKLRDEKLKKEDQNHRFKQDDVQKEIKNKELMERLLGTYSKLPKKHALKRPYEQQIKALMEELNS